MEAKIIKVTDKGQISLPIQIRESLQISQGDELLITQSSNVIIMKKVKKDDFRDLLKHAERIAQKLWDNPGDEVWNEV